MKSSYTIAPGLPKGTLVKVQDTNSRRDKILEVICGYFQVNLDQLKAKTRQRHVVLPRQVAMVMLRKHTHLGIVKIGRFFLRDHTTVLHSSTTVINLCYTDPEIKRQVDEVENKILS